MVETPTPTYQNPTIDAGSAVSSVVDCTTASPIRVYMPNGWQGDTISFLVSPDNAVFYDLFDVNGQEVTAHIIPRTAVDISGPRAGEYFKVRAGTRDAPVEQDVQRIFTVVLVR